MIPEASPGRDNRALSTNFLPNSSFGFQNEEPRSYLVNLVRSNPERFLSKLLQQ